MPTAVCSKRFCARERAEARTTNLENAVFQRNGGAASGILGHPHHARRDRNKALDTLVNWGYHTKAKYEALQNYSNRFEHLRHILAW